VKDPYNIIYHTQPQYELALANINNHDINFFFAKNHDINLININMQINYPAVFDMVAASLVKLA
jgi:hypothetical protein